MLGWAATTAAVQIKDRKLKSLVDVSDEAN